MNALDALVLPRYIDTRPPVIQKVSVLPAGASSQPTDLILNGNTRVEMNAYDQVDGNADRRRLGIYQAGYQILRSDLSPIGDIKWTISFARIPAPEAVTIAYAKGSKSGATGETIFDYIVTNQVDGDNYSESYFDPSVLDNGSYVLRVFAADEAGNKTYADTKFEVRK